MLGTSTLNRNPAGLSNSLYINGLKESAVTKSQPSKSSKLGDCEVKIPLVIKNLPDFYSPTLITQNVKAVDDIKVDQIDRLTKNVMFIFDTLLKTFNSHTVVLAELSNLQLQN